MRHAVDEGLNTTPGTARYVHLDGLRGLASLNVMLSHAVVAFDFAVYTGLSDESHGQWEVALSGWPLLLPVAGANYAVCIFLVLSGFVLAHVYAGTRLLLPALAVKRWVRLALPILAAVLFSYGLAALGLGFSHAAALITKSRWLASQMMQTPAIGAALNEGVYVGLIGPADFSSSYNSALWTMPIEFAGSLLLMTLFMLARGLRPLRAVGSATAGAGLLAAGVLCHSFYIALMLFGASIRMFRFSRCLRNRLAYPLLLASLVLGTVPFSVARGRWWNGLVALAPPPPRAGWWSAWPGFTPIDGVAFWHGVGAIILLVVVDQTPSMRAWLGRPLPRFLGVISFPLYLLHIPLLFSVGCGVFVFAHSAGLGYGAACAVATAAYSLSAIGRQAGATLHRNSVRQRTPRAAGKQNNKLICRPAKRGSVFIETPHTGTPDAPMFR